MRIGKTEKARLALDVAKAGGPDLRDRRILILADGKRTRAELLALLGVDSGASIDRLVREGYLTGDVAATPAPAPAPVTTAAASNTRRSIVAAKMYLIDMLQLQRSPAAAELRLAIQSTSDAHEIAERLIVALDYLLSATTPSYGARVFMRVEEVLPEDLLPRLERLRVALSA